MNRLAASAAAALLLTGSANAAPDGLHVFVWKNRVLVIASAPGDHKAARQRDTLAGHRQAMADRDMVVLHVSAEKVETVFGRAETLNAETVRRQAGIAPETRFAVVLIGKDGGIKLRETQPVTAEALFGLIDAMPMRAGEVRR